MSLCATYFAAPLVAVRLNYKSVTKSYVFSDHFNQSNLFFLELTIFVFYLLLATFVEDYRLMNYYDSLRQFLSGEILIN